eukprot:g7040.t1
MRRAPERKKKKKKGSRRREKGKLNLRDFLNRPDIVENETERFLISVPKVESSESDEAAWRDSALKLNAERLRTEKRLRDSERTLQETAWDPKEYTESGFHILSCMSTSTRKKIDQLPKANEMVASLIPSIEANLSSRPSQSVYKSLRKIQRRNYHRQQKQEDDQKDEERNVQMKTRTFRRHRRRIRKGERKQQQSRMVRTTTTPTTRILHHLHQKSVNREKSLKLNIVTQMSSIMQTTLPRDMIQRATNDQIRRHHFKRFLEIMQHVIRSFSLRELHHCMGVWQNYVQKDRDRERVESACTIQRAWWRSLARFELNTRRELRDRQEAESRRVIAERNHAASTIQRAYRTSCAKHLTSLLRELRDLRDQSIRVLQRSYRCC